MILKKQLPLLSCFIILALFLVQESLLGKHSQSLKDSNLTAQFSFKHSREELTIEEKKQRLIEQKQFIVKDNEYLDDNLMISFIKNNPILKGKIQMIMRNIDSISSRQKRRIEMFTQDPQRAREEHLHDLGAFYLNELNLDIRKVEELVQYEQEYLEHRDKFVKVALSNSNKQKDGTLLMNPKDAKELKEMEHHHQSHIRKHIGDKAYQRIEIFKL